MTDPVAWLKARGIELAAALCTAGVLIGGLALGVPFLRARILETFLYSFCCVSAAEAELESTRGAKRRGDRRRGGGAHRDREVCGRLQGSANLGSWSACDPRRRRARRHQAGCRRRGHSGLRWPGGRRRVKSSARHPQGGVAREDDGF